MVVDGEEARRRPFEYNVARSIPIEQGRGPVIEPLLASYELVDHQAIAVQAAVLEEVTYVKVVATGAKDGLATAKQAFNWLTSVAAIKITLDDTPPPTTSEAVMARAQHWTSRPKEAARVSLFNSLSEMLQVSSVDLGLMSTRLIEEAAAGLDISEDLLLSQQAELVADAYMKQCLEGLREELKKQDPEAVRKTEASLAEELAKMSPADRLAIQKSLNLRSLSAQSLREVIIRSGAPIAGIAALQAGGFGTYLALTTVMHAVFTSMLGITLPFAAYTGATSALAMLTGPAGIMFSLSLGALGYFWGRRKIERSQCAMIVWTCVLHAGRRLTPATVELPSARRHLLLTSGSDEQVSGVPPEVLGDDLGLRESFNAASGASDAKRAAQRNADKNDASVRSYEERLRRVEDRLAATVQKTLEDQALKTALKSQMDQDRRTKQRLEEELVSAKNEAENSLRLLSEKSQEEERAVSRHHKHLERRSSELKALWSIHFKNLDFHSQPLRWAADQDFSGWLEIERALKELSEATDPVILSRSKMHTTGEHHLGFTIPHKVPCRIFYVVSNGRIGIRRMCKKKDV